MPNRYGNWENVWVKVGKTKMLPLSYLKIQENWKRPTTGPFFLSE